MLSLPLFFFLKLNYFFLDQITSFAVLEDLSQMAIGLCNGLVVLFKGDLAREKISKQLVLQADAENPITGLGFRGGKPTQLFVVTSATISVFNTTLPQPQQEILDDTIGCGVGCTVMSDEDELVVGRTEAVYFYSPEGRGQCCVFEGEKKILAWFRNYLIVVGQDANNLKFNTFNIYDLKNKFIAYSENRFQNITQVVSEWGSIFLITGDGKIFQLEEKDTQTKLDTLFKKNLYSVAISLAKAQQLDYDSIIDIFRKYGNHLYSKGDYDGSIQQYIRTIGKLEPSYVIRRFLDAQRIHNLTSYLQALHEKGLANADHTTLLFNCYTKLKDEKKLDEFIKSDELTYEPETAIKLCRQAGYFDHALYLAKKHNEHEWYLKILLEDARRFHEALEYIATLEFSQGAQILKKYGKTLVTELPDETTALLTKLCVSSPKAVPDEFIHIYVGEAEWLTKFLSFIVTTGKASELIFNTLLELYLRGDDKMRENAAQLLTMPQAKFSDDQALVLCKVHNFRWGILHLYEKLMLYKDIVQYHMDNREYEMVVKSCKKYGDKDPNLWVHALSYFAVQPGDVKKEILEVLGYIDRDNLLPPLLVIQTLSQKPTATLAVIRDYITRRLAHENQLIAEDFRQIKSYQEESKKMRTEIHDLKTSARVFQHNKCTYCNAILDLPVVHFLCMHSFHQRCLGENENECPVCAPQNKKILEIKRHNEESAGRHDQFFKQVRPI
jgi:hypothetical protein